MSATRKPAKRAATPKTAAGRTTARKSTSTRRRRTASTTRRRTRPKVATTVGAALGTLVVTLLLDASWPVRIGLVLVALLLVGGYLYLQGRRHDAAAPEAGQDPAPLGEPAPPTSTPAPPASTPAPPTTTTTEDTP